jgi:hypothetical protein
MVWVRFFPRDGETQEGQVRRILRGEVDSAEVEVSEILQSLSRQERRMVIRRAAKEDSKGK